METKLIIGLVFLTLALWFWAIIDITRSRFKKPIMNTICLLAVLFFPVLGSILYFQFRKRFVIEAPRKFQPNFKKSELRTT
ncbi:MAG: PLD nuclease N-terminal domain-containing protein [Bacteroidetes bacterium]|nr:PLD nuclease N-terminal domain-containing protein [Bacteroidota bacterium]